jgi:sulfate adenylyltransferase subunit 2
MNYLDELESISIRILREAYANFKNLGMLWSMGKDSTVLLWLVRRAFFGHVPFPLIHIDTHFKIPEMIVYRDRLVRELKLPMIVGVNEIALASGNTFPGGKVNRLTCCQLLKTTALTDTINGTGVRYRFNHARNQYERETNPTPFYGIIAGARADEEGSRSKERYFSPRGVRNEWDIDDQPPEFWYQFKTDFASGTNVRIHPLLDWTELNIWEYIERENIPTVSLYYNHGDGKRYRSLGCYPCTAPVDSTARTVGEIIEELRTGKFSRVAERSGRAQDAEDGGGLETLRREGYM